MPIFEEVFNHKWVLKFLENFFCVYLDTTMAFIFQFVNMMYHIDWFVFEESLNPWDKADLIVV